MTTKCDYWACPRPLTGHWGSGQVYDRIVKNLGQPDVCFGKTDGIPDGVKAIDKNNGYDWLKLPFKDNEFEFGYWDPPYDRMYIKEDGTAGCELYKKEGLEIWRVCKRLAILHTFVYPKAWFKRAERESMVAVTMGPLKQIRILNVFKKVI